MDKDEVAMTTDEVNGLIQLHNDLIAVYKKLIILEKQLTKLSDISPKRANYFHEFVANVQIDIKMYGGLAEVFHDNLTKLLQPIVNKNYD